MFLANSFAKTGYDVTIVILSTVKDTMEVHRDISVHTIDYYYNKGNSTLFKKAFLKSIKLYKLRKIIRHIKPDSIIVFMPVIIRDVLMATYGIKTPIIGSERDNPYALTERKFRQAEKIYMKCTNVVLQAKRAQQVFQKKIQEKISDYTKYKYTEKEEIMPYFNGEKTFITASRLIKKKENASLIMGFEK